MVVDIFLGSGLAAVEARLLVENRQAVYKKMHLISGIVVLSFNFTKNSEQFGWIFDYD